MKEKIKVNKLRNEVASYLLQKMKTSKGVKGYHSVRVSPIGDEACIRIDSNVFLPNIEAPFLSKTIIKCTIENNHVQTEWLIGELDTYIEQTLQSVDMMLSSNIEEA